MSELKLLNKEETKPEIAPLKNLDNIFHYTFKVLKVGTIGGFASLAGLIGYCFYEIGNEIRTNTKKIFSDSIANITYENLRGELETIASAKVTERANGKIVVSNDDIWRKYSIVDLHHRDFISSGVFAKYLRKVKTTGTTIYCKSDKETASREDRNYLRLLEKIDSAQNKVRPRPFTENQKVPHYERR